VTPKEATSALVDGLNALGIPYMLVGSLSSNLYGTPRATQDADFVVQLREGVISDLIKLLGPPFQLERQMSFETVTATSRFVLRLADNPFCIELFLLSNDAHDQERFARRRYAQVFNRDISVPTMEDVIITKLRWSQSGRRAKDFDDVRNVIAVQGDRIDWDYVTSWCDRHGTRELLEQCRCLPPLG
jgi:hypothetical protein